MRDTNIAEIYKRVLPIQGWLEFNEIIALHNLAKEALRKSNNEYLIEIGSFKGRSTVTLALACEEMKKGKLLAIDPHKNSRDHQLLGIESSIKDLKNNLKNNRLSEFVEILPMDSQRAFKRKTHLKSILVFLDGNHEYKYVKKDYLLWSKTLVYGGYLILHDTLNLSGPRKVSREIMRNRHYAYIGNCGDLACFRKEKEISVRNWIKKLFSLVVFWLFFKIYKPIQN